MANSTVTGASLSGIYGRLNGVGGYHPISASTFADWSMQAGDVVTVVRGEDAYQSPVHTTKMVWKGTPKIEINSTGNKEREAIAKVSRKKYGRGSAQVNSEMEIYRQFTSSDGYLHSAIYASASVLRTEISNTASGMYSYVNQTAAGIRTDVANTSSQLQSSINQQADRIGLVVEGTGSNAHIKAAQIAASINNQTGQSLVRISADVIDINGVVLQLATMELACDFMTCAGVKADNNLTVENDEGLEVNGHVMRLANAEVSGENLILTYTDGSSTTFRKAGSGTTLSGSWSGRTYTVTASPQGNTISELTTVHVLVPQGALTATASAKVATPVSGGSGYTDHGDPIYMYLVKNGRTVYLKSANSTSEGLTYAQTTISDANLVEENIKSGVRIFGVTGSYGGGTTLSGEWNSNTYTVTASPQGETISVSPVVHVIVPQGALTATATAKVATSTSGGSGYTDHGNAVSMYLVKSGLTVSLKSANSTSEGLTYARTTLSDANLVEGNIKSGVTIFGVAGSYFGVTTLNGGWSGSVAGGKSYKVTASPQGNVLYSPALDQIYLSGSKSWAADYKSFDQLIKVCDEHGEDLYQDTLNFDTTNSWYAGKASVTLNDPTWNPIIGEIGASRTISVTTSGRTDASGTAANLTKSATLTLIADGTTVYLQHSGTEVAKVALPAGIVTGEWQKNSSGYNINRWTATSNYGGSASVVPVHHILTGTSTTITIRIAETSGSGYIDHGGTKTVYLVADTTNKRIQLRSVNSTSGGETYGQISAGTGIGIYDTNSNEVTGTKTISSSIDLWGGCKLNGSWVWGGKVTIKPASESHSPTIDYVWTSQSIPSGATELNSLKRQYELAKEDGDNFLIRVNCGGKTKTYYCTP